MLGAVAFMTACKDDGSGNGGSINYEEGYKYLTSLNVSDAKMIYQKEQELKLEILITKLIYLETK